MYITITNDNTIMGTPSRGFPGEDTGEKEKPAKRTPSPIKIIRKLTPLNTLHGN